ncbi:hypothetical protein QQ045_004459 [Rhodiola kirilowii]
MEELEMLAANDSTIEFTQPRIIWDHPDFDDISAWETFQPNDDIYKRSILNLRQLLKNKDDHICQHGSIMLANKHLNTKYIADEIAEEMNASLRFEAREIRANIRRYYGYEISYLKAWQGKQLALVKLFGEWDESFYKLPHLMQALVDSSPEIFVKWDVTPLDNELIYAFKHCRPVLSIDGTYMYGKWVVVESESNSKWKWFMSCIQDDIT